MGVDSSLLMHTGNQKYLVLGRGTTQKLNNTIIRAEAKYSINFTESRRSIV